MAKAGPSVSELIEAISTEPANINDIRALISPENVNDPDPATGSTPLITAALLGDPNVVQLLLTNGADPNIKHRELDISPLMFALTIDAEDRDEEHTLAVISMLSNSLRTSLEESIAFLETHENNFDKKALGILTKAKMNRAQHKVEPHPPSTPNPRTLNKPQVPK